MPRLADHNQRRRAITDAARDVVARDGLTGATFQSVAAQAGISVRLVQYYFGTKEAFLRATHEAVVADAGARFSRRLAELGAAAPREVVGAILSELLPTEDGRRREALVLNAFHAAALRGDENARAAALGPARFLTELVADQLRQAKGIGPDDDAGGRGQDAILDARLVVAAAAGLTQAVLADPASAEESAELLDRLLDRFFDA